MKQIFVNLKRFDVPKTMGGICSWERSDLWVEWVVEECVRSGISKLEGLNLTFLLPEALIVPAVKKLRSYPGVALESMSVGCQGVYREDVSPGGNFGAFSTNRPAAAAKSLGCNWTMIGHSEERKDKLGLIAVYDPSVITGEGSEQAAQTAVDMIINEEVKCAVKRGLKVLLCIGETAEEKGTGEFEQQKLRIEAVLKRQLLNGLKGLNQAQLEEVVIGYEPIWAIGPGKKPPENDYIAFVSAYIKDLMERESGCRPAVVYGGGLKEENAGLISKIETIDGGLVALTKFVGKIGFYPDDLKKIIDKYLE